MIADTIITRLQAKGLQVTDLRHSLPRRNYTWATRQVSSIRRIAVHHDAVEVSQGYNPVDRYTAEANYHAYIKIWDVINRQDVYGDGIMYHVKVACDGHIYITRDFEDITWHVGSPNGTALGVCADGNFVQNNQPFLEQVRSLNTVLDVLTTQCPEFPASVGDVWGHREFVQFGGTSTECPANLLSTVQSYRAGHGMNFMQYGYYNQTVAQVQPAPVSFPPVPQPAQQPTGQANGDVPVNVAPAAPPPPPAPSNFSVRVLPQYDGLRVRLAPGDGTAIGLYFKGTTHEVYPQTFPDKSGKPWYKLAQAYNGQAVYIASWAVERV